MKINVCSPNLTRGNDEDIVKFYEELVKYIEEYTEINRITNITRINELMYSMDKDTLLIIFNTSRTYSKEIIELLEKANEKEAVVWTVAMNKDERLPIDIVKKEQSFDIDVRLENRKTKNIAIIAQIFAREVISKALPTFYSEGKKTFFVSHKRLDGEDIAAKLCDKINLLCRTRDRKAGREAFRDVVEVCVGEETQEVIDSALSISDVLIFLHTPKSVDSDWIQKEVTYAMINNIPILWVRIDGADVNKLKVIPSERPHIECSSSDFCNTGKLEDYVNKIEDICFRLVMNNRNNVWKQKDKFESWANNFNIRIEEKNKTLQIYKICYKENRLGKYNRRPIVQYLQYFGRTIKEDDVDIFKNYILENECSDNMFDTAVMLSCNEHIMELENKIYKNGFDKHLEYWKNEVLTLEKPRKNRKIVISGAFPDSEEYNKYNLTEALNIFTREIISSGYTLVFGAHPTFQKLIFAIASEECVDPKKAVKMFISREFEYDINEIKDCATICETEKRENKDKSLTYMREQMLNESDIAAVICIGGKKKDVPEIQGVDEEIEIARKNKLPVFLVGTVGGLTEKRATEFHKENCWSKINDAGKDLNEMFRSSLEYRKIFAEMLKYIEKDDKIDQ